MDLMPLLRSDLPVGIAVPSNVWDSQGRLLLRQGQIVVSESQIDHLLALSASVSSKELAAFRLHTSPGEVLLSSSVSQARGKSLFDLWTNLPIRLKGIWKALHYVEFVPGIEQISKDLLTLVEQSTDIGLYLMMRQEKIVLFDYPYSHSIHTAMVATLMSKQLRWTQARTESLVKAALTMNISIGELQSQMASQDFPMLGRQEAKIRRHPHESSALLSAAGIIDQLCLQTVRNHHERPDGFGYPSQSSEVSLDSQALRLADVFCAKLTPRMIRPALTAQDAERHMFREGKVHENLMPLAMAIIKEVGIYPPGNLVLLKSGEVGVVVKRSASGKTPIVAVITDEKGRPVTSTFRRDTADPAFHIEGSYVDKKLVGKLAPERLFGFSMV